MMENIKMEKRMEKGSLYGMIILHMKVTLEIIHSRDMVLYNNHVGTYKWSDGREYTGDWLDSKMNGNGTYHWPNGKTYKGAFIDDLREGYGMMIWDTGKSYKGYWKKGKMHGKGKLIDSKGKITEGIWDNGTNVKVETYNQNE